MVNGEHVPTVCPQPAHARLARERHHLQTRACLRAEHLHAPITAARRGALADQDTIAVWVGRNAPRKLKLAGIGTTAAERAQAGYALHRAARFLEVEHMHHEVGRVDDEELRAAGGETGR